LNSKQKLVTAGLLTHDLNHKIKEAKTQLELCKKANLLALEVQKEEREKNRVQLGRKQLTLSFCKKI
jgi:hypothetical protein